MHTKENNTAIPLKEQGCTKRELFYGYDLESVERFKMHLVYNTLGACDGETEEVDTDAIHADMDLICFLNRIASDMRTNQDYYRA